MWTGLSLPKSLKTRDFTASILECRPSSESDEDDEMQSPILSEILSITESRSRGWSAMDLCSKIEQEKMEAEKMEEENGKRKEREMQYELFKVRVRPEPGSNATTGFF